MQKIDCFLSNNIYFCKCQKLMRKKKKSKEDEQTLEELNSAHRRSQAKCQLTETSYIERIKLSFLFKLVLKSPNGEWAITYTYHTHTISKTSCKGQGLKQFYPDVILLHQICFP